MHSFMHLPILGRQNFSPIKRNITSINMMVTEVCNMACPNCTVGSPWTQNKEFYPLSYFKNAARFLNGIERIHITGGEPTIHPEFEFLSSQFRDVFNCQLLTLETNALWLKKHAETVIRYYDKVYISVYTPETYDGCPDNRKIISWFQNFCKDRKAKTEVITGIVDHVPITKRGNSICHRGISETVQYTAGLLYPCCTGSGIPGASGIPLTSNWREEIEKVHIPCDVCWFAEE